MMRVKTVIMTIIMIILFLQTSYTQIDDRSPFGYALKLYNEKFYDLASQQFSEFISSNPRHPQRPEAHYLLASCYRHLGQDDLAVIELKKLALDFPQHDKAKSAWMEIGNIYQHLNNLSEAAKAYENVKILYPASSLAPKGLLSAGEMYYKLNDLENSYRVLIELIGRYQESREALIAQLKLSDVEYRRGNIGNAIKFVEKLREVDDDSVKNIATIKLASVHLEGSNLGEVSQLLKQVDAKYQNDEFIFVKTEFLWKNKEFQSAKKLLLNNKSNISDQSRLQKYLAVTFSLLKEYEEGLTFLNSIPEGQLHSSSLPYLVLFAAKSGDKTAFLSYIDSVDNSWLQGKLTELMFESLYKKDHFKDIVDLYDQLKLKFPVYSATKMNKFFLRSLYNLKNWNRLKTEIKITFTPDVKQKLEDDLEFLNIMILYHEKNFIQARQLMEDFKKKYVHSEYIPEIVSLEKKLKLQVPLNSDLSFNHILDLFSEFIENRNPARQHILLGNLYMNQKAYNKAIHHYRSALRDLTDDGEVASIYKKMYEAYNAKYLTLSKNSYRDSAAVYLQNYLEKETDEQSKTAVLTEFMISDLAEIVKTPERKNATLTRIDKLLPTANTNSQSKLLYLKLKLLPVDTSFAIYRKGLNTTIFSEDELLYSYIIYFSKADESEFVKLNLQLIQNFPESVFAKSALNNLLNHYFRNDQFDALNQLVKYYQSRMQYCDDIDISTYLYADLMSRGKIEDLLSLAGDIQKLLTDDYLLGAINRNYGIFLYYLGKTFYISDDIKQTVHYLNKFLNIYFSKDKYFNDVIKMLSDIAVQRGSGINAMWYLEHYEYLGEENKSDYLKIKTVLADLYEKNQLYDKLTELAAKMSGKFPDKEQMLWSYYKIKGDIYSNPSPKHVTTIANFKKRFKNEKNVKFYVTELYIDQLTVEKNNKNFKKAEQLLKLASKNAIGDQKAKIEYLKGYLLTIQNNTKKALEVLTKFSDKYGDSEYLCKVYNTLGNVFYRMEKKPEALEVYKKALTVAKSDDDKKLSLNNLIVLDKELGFWDGVLNYCRQYVNEFPDDPYIIDKQIMIGLSYLRLNQFEEAINHFRKIKPYIPAEREPEVQFYIGESYYNGGRYEEAIREFLKIPMLSKKTELQWEASAFYFAGQSYERMGKKNEAIKMYEEIVKRPGILWDLKKEAKKRIEQIK